MKYSNLHTHTTFSDGKHTIEENILAAIDLGMVSIGISDHSFTDFDLTYCMKREHEGEYIAEIGRLREKYHDQIEVYAGLEYDGYTNLQNRGAYDYLIGDCHYVKTCDGYHSVDHCIEGHMETVENYFDGDYTAYAKAYYETYIERTVLNRPDVLGHFDLVTKFSLVDETDPKYISMAKEALIACLEVTPLIELNTGAIARGLRKVPYPAVYLLDEIKSHGGQLVLSSDSHDIKNLIFGFDDAIAMLRENGIYSIALLRGGKFEEVGII